MEPKPETTIATLANGKWQLLHQHTKGEWQNLRLCGPGKRGRRSWLFGWNGWRLSQSPEMANLKECHPGVHQWVIETLSAK
jgi:hypothetical protein